MILFTVISAEQEVLLRIAETLLQNNLAINLNMEGPLQRILLTDEKPVQVQTMQLTGKTRAVLFPEIESTVKKLFPEKSPELFSTPIVHMDWEQSKQLLPLRK